MSVEPKYIWMDGELVEYEKATVHFLTSALHFGTAVFEGIRCYETPLGPAIFRLREHMERLINSVKILGLHDLPFSRDELCEATRQVVIANGFHECYIRPLAYHACAPPTLVLTKGKTRIGIAAWEFGSYLGDDARELGVCANVSSFTRHHPNVMMTKGKITGNYSNSALAKTDSLQLGFDEAIMLDPQGFVAECTGENLFLVRKGQIITPPTATVLEGITRDSLIKVASDLGYQVVEQPISRDQLYISDEVFVCGTAAECIAVREIDHRVIGSGKMGPITHAIQSPYWEAIHGQNPRYEEWLDLPRPSSVSISLGFTNE